MNISHSLPVSFAVFRMLCSSRQRVPIGILIAREEGGAGEKDVRNRVRGNVAAREGW